MSSADAVAAVLWVGVTFYAVFGGADFGAGFWALLAGGGERGRRSRELIDWAIGPVWESNHVWLIFVLVVLWTGFSRAFEAITSTLFIPLSLAALGIVLRGAGFAFHTTMRARSWAGGGAAPVRRLVAADAVLHGHRRRCGGRWPRPGRQRRRRRGHELGQPALLLVGALFVATSAYLAAVFLVHDARRAGAADLERAFTRRALGAALAVGPIGLASLLVLRADARPLFDRLVDEALPLVAASALCAIVVLVVLRGGARGARSFAIGAVAAVIWGWGVAQFPYLLPRT